MIIALVFVVTKRLNYFYICCIRYNRSAVCPGFLNVPIHEHAILWTHHSWVFTKIVTRARWGELCGWVWNWWHITVCCKWQCYLLFSTHWGRATHISVSKLPIVDSDNGMLLIGPMGTKFSEVLIKLCTFSFQKMHLKMSSGKWRSFCLGLNVSKVTTDPDHASQGSCDLIRYWFYTIRII